MGVSTSIGPISGIDYGKLITGLTGIEQKPIDDITNKITTLDKQNHALLDVLNRALPHELSVSNQKGLGSVPNRAVRERKGLKKIEPTHPHPMSSDHPPFNALLGPGAGIVDRLRDMLTGRAKQ